MKDWFVIFVPHDDPAGEDVMICLPSLRKLLWWLMRNARRCGSILIFQSENDRRNNNEPE